MRWEDERYVKVYTRDTLTWLGLGWEGQAVLLLLFRKVDRAGIVEIDDHEPPEALASLLRLPVEITTIAWGRLSAGKRPVVTLRDRTSRALIIPNFLPAQEAKQSDRARAQKHREMARAREIVTPRDDASQGVTKHHEPSHAVTPSRTDSQEQEPLLTSPSASPTSEKVQVVEPPRVAAQESAAGLLPAASDSEFVRYLRVEWPDIANPNDFERRAHAAYPGIDLLGEARKARAWETADRGRLKRNHGRFFQSWLARSAKDAAAAPRATGRPQASAVAPEWQPPDRRAATAKHLAEQAEIAKRSPGSKPANLQEMFQAAQRSALAKAGGGST